MQLSIYYIGWKAEDYQEAYGLMKKYGYSVLEIAPTRIFSKKPYEKLSEARIWYNTIHKEYGFVIPSMQSIWFGKKEKLFGTEEERIILLDYTKQAIIFA